MLKYLWFVSVLVLPCAAQAQMNEMMGVLAIDGMLSAEDYQNMGKMNRALDDLRFRQELSDLITETQIASLNGYFDKSNLRFNGLSGIDWDVASAATGQYYIELKNLDMNMCELCKNGQWGTHHIDVNEGGKCEKVSNNVKLYF